MSNPQVASAKAKDSSPYPGIPARVDGSAAVVWVETNITQASCAYPITS